MRKAEFFEQKDDGSVLCLLCPHGCLIRQGQYGICRVRLNQAGELFSLNSDGVSSLQVDPVEKKPLYHYFPGGKVLSLGTYGCNMHCDFCQNHEISSMEKGRVPSLQPVLPESLVEQAVGVSGCIGMAFTYNEPVVFFEWMKEVALLASMRGLHNVMVSNGFISPGPLDEALKWIHAFNIDLKAFNPSFYRKITGSELQPVLDNLVRIRRSGRHLEITNLVIPGLNDDPKEFLSMIKWICSELGPSTILHLSRYFPRFNRNTPATGTGTMELLYELASRHLNYVYIGNLQAEYGSHTYCESCKRLVIFREGYRVSITGLDKLGYCTHCGHHIAEMRNA